ncbi:MAG: hypothetical protein II453_11140 [Alphaproteobacteria bacterium]|nr:hypothetical protein [Alphaproteobacteria bacterium]
MKEYTIKFNDWHPEGTASPRVIKFTNDGQFTRNSVTSHEVPQNEEMFEDTIKAYLNNENCELIAGND